MVETVLEAALSLGPDLLTVGAIGITASVGLVALVAGWKFITKMIL